MFTAYYFDNKDVINFAVSKKKDNLMLFFKDNSSYNCEKRTKKKLDLSNLSRKQLFSFSLDKSRFYGKKIPKQLYFDDKGEIYFIEKNTICYSGEDITYMSEKIIPIPEEVHEYLSSAQSITISVFENNIKYYVDGLVFLELKPNLYQKHSFAGKKSHAFIMDVDDLEGIFEIKNSTVRIFKKRNSDYATVCVVDNVLKRSDKKSLGFCIKVPIMAFTDKAIIIELDSEDFKKQLKKLKTDMEPIRVFEGEKMYMLNNLMIKKSLYLMSYFNPGKEAVVDNKPLKLKF